MSLQLQPEQNYLLGAVPAEALLRLTPHLERVALPLGQVLFESGRKTGYVFFPIDCVVSLLCVTEDGESAEIAMVGNEGIVGVTLFMGGDTTPSLATVLNPGVAFRLNARYLTEEFARCQDVRRLLLQYTQAMLSEIAQTATCNRHHSVEQQLCRLLLLCLDRSASSDLSMTHDLISNMLGLRHEGITQAAGQLQREGLIDYRRGHIRVLDRARLERRSCECYAVVREEFDRLLPGMPFIKPKTSRTSGHQFLRPQAELLRTPMHSV